jgi:hypothetical protein
MELEMSSMNESKRCADVINGKVSVTEETNTLRTKIIPIEQTAVNLHRVSSQYRS